VVANSRVGVKRHLEDLRGRGRGRGRGGLARGRRQRRLSPGLLLARRVGSRWNLTGSEEIRSEGAMKRVNSSLGALEHLGRLCRYRSQPAGNVGTKGSE
jgi:hypothetical protein